MTPDGNIDRAPVVSRDGRRLVFIRQLNVSQGPLFMMRLDTLNAAGPPAELVNPAPLFAIAAVWEPGDASPLYSVGSHMGASHLPSRRIPRHSRRGPAC